MTGFFLTVFISNNSVLYVLNKVSVNNSEINYKLLSSPQKTILFDTTIKLVESEELFTEKVAVINNEPFIFILSSNLDEKKINIYTVNFILKKSIILIVFLTKKNFLQKK
jgi:hypothetical protein